MRDLILAALQKRISEDREGWTWYVHLWQELCYKHDEMTETALREELLKMEKEGQLERRNKRYCHMYLRVDAKKTN